LRYSVILFWRFFAAVRLSGLTFSNPMNTLRPYRERKLRNTKRGGSRGPRKPSGRRAAEQGDKLAPLQLIKSRTSTCERTGSLGRRLNNGPGPEVPHSHPEIARLIGQAAEERRQFYRDRHIGSYGQRQAASPSPARPG
jgi:hypothetical protein